MKLEEFKVTIFQLIMLMILLCRVTLDMLSLQSETGPSWENKTEKAFWRGRDSRQERLDLVRMSHRHPDVIDARLTHMFFFKHSDDLGEIVKRVSFFDFFKVFKLYTFMTCTCYVRLHVVLKFQCSLVY